MPTFENLKDLENYFKKNPKVVLEQNIGKTIEGECPVCKDKEEIKIIDLLLFKDGNYYIIDYKTTKEKSAEHITQVAFYKKAIIWKLCNHPSYKDLINNMSYIFMQELQSTIYEIAQDCG